MTSSGLLLLRISNQQRWSSFLDNCPGRERMPVTCANWLHWGPIMVGLQYISGGQKALKAFRVQNRLVLSFPLSWVHVWPCAYYDEQIRDRDSALRNRVLR